MIYEIGNASTCGFNITKITVVEIIQFVVVNRSTFVLATNSIGIGVFEYRDKLDGKTIF